MGRAFPSHPTLLSVGGCKWGSTPLSSYTTPSTMPREEGARSFIRTGGTPGWLWNLRPGTRGFDPLRGSADQRAGRPGRAYPPPDPRKRSLLYVGQPPLRALTPRCGTGLPHKVAHVTCCPQGNLVPVTWTRARRKPNGQTREGYNSPVDPTRRH